jgi:hypothetical protein
MVDFEKVHSAASMLVLLAAHAATIAAAAGLTAAAAAAAAAAAGLVALTLEALTAFTNLNETGSVPITAPSTAEASKDNE